MLCSMTPTEVTRQLGVAGADHLFHAPCPFDKVVFLAEIDFWVLHRCLENVLSRLDANVNKCSWKTSKAVVIVRASAVSSNFF